ncbi:MAG TPA: DUF5666 domain-containing protein [Burkholderiaceae bacterium]|jgi:hypothetical protein|nr:DUF5666 domain-containing protein [Burkholderiaceae bacterium]
MSMVVYQGRRRAAAWARLMAGVSVAFVLASCGGTDVAGVGSGGTGIRLASVSYGSISGFGSVIVNGVRYDDAGAALSNDDGTAPGPLGLGMVVEVRGDIDSTGLAGTADAINVVSEARGTVVNRSSSGFSLLGLPVRANASTVYDDAASVSDGDYVEVYGIYDRSSGTLTATRIERRAPGGAFKVRGTVGAVDAVAKRFQLGTITVDYSATLPAPSGLAAGTPVRVHASGEPVAGMLAATRIDIVTPPALGNVSKLEIEGVIDRFVSLADFSVDGVRVDGAAAAFEGGVASGLGIGVRVEVEGPVESGIVRASRIEFEDEEDGEFELKGLVTDFVDVASFRVRGTRVDASGSVRYEGGGAADLRDGACVQVKGKLQTTPTGSEVLATDIHFESSCS